MPLQAGCDIEVLTSNGSQDHVWLARLLAIIDSAAAGGCQCIVRWWYQTRHISKQHKAEMDAFTMLPNEVFRSELLECVGIESVSQVLPTAITHASSPDAMQSVYTFQRQYNPASTTGAFTTYPASPKGHHGTELSPIQITDETRSLVRVALRKHFGYTSFRSHQLECCTRLLAKQDAMLVLATGGGKSICFWLPVLMQGGSGIIICPLKSLMSDQVQF